MTPRPRLPLLALLAGALLAACGGGGGEEIPEPEGPALEMVSIEREWQFERYRGRDRTYEPSDPVHHDTGGEVSAFEDMGGFIYNLPTGDRRARMEIYSNASGMTYWLYNEAPAADNNFDPLMGARTHFTQRQVFRKLRDDATLRYVVTHARVQLIDHNTDPLDDNDCPFELEFEDVPVYDQRTGLFVGLQKIPAGVVTKCSKAMEGNLMFDIAARRGGDGKPLAWVYGDVEVNGARGQWQWSFDDFFSGLKEAVFNVDFDHVGDGSGSWAVVHLKDPLVLEVPLGSVGIDGLVYVESKLRGEAFNHRQRESYADAYLRDPASAGGNGWQASGLEAVAVSSVPRLGPIEDPTPDCARAGETAAGQIAFEHAAYDADELPGLGARITLVRTGSSAGEASVLFETRPGSATAPADYTHTAQRVRFRDGQQRRTVRVPITLDGTPEYVESLGLHLSQPRGCAGLGARIEAVLNVHDDDNPRPPATTYTVGGTVVGLAGSGLVLEDRLHFTDLAVAADGSFVLPRSYRPGSAYDIAVKQPPTGPAQVCEVLRGRGNVAADVADIEVRCETPALPGGFDTGFGVLGKVAEGLPGGAIAIARQSSGHIVATNGARLVRYTAAGRLDTGFGGGAGFVDNLLPMTGGEVADLAVLPDDRIVVAGRVLQPGKSTPYFQMAAARFAADGTRDTGFGQAGLATFRLAGVGEDARRVLAQPDGRVLLVGQSTALVNPALPSTANNNIAVVRLATNGSIDASFGTGGATIADALKLDFATAAALQPDGRLFVAGSTTDNNADPTDTVFTRLSADGQIEPGFGRAPAYSMLSDEAVDAAVQPDGKIVLLVVARGLNAEVTLARLNPDGSLDTAFGTQGLVRGDFGPHDDLPRAMALQADGKIVVAAQLSAAVGPPDFGLLRYLPDGTPDTGFGTGGVLRVDFFGGWDSANDIVVQPDGRIVVAGFARSGLATHIAMVRLLP